MHGPECRCTSSHALRRVVLTGGPGAGKTAVLEVVRKNFCRHVVVLPEAASIIFGGGFPRGASVRARKAAQRAICRVQWELEETAQEQDGAAVVLCDRGTVDGAAYWPGPVDESWAEVGSTSARELARYDCVIHLRTPLDSGGYNHANPVRTESNRQALDIDARIADAWAGHPHRHFVERHHDFLQKVAEALRLLRGEVPACCRPEVPGLVDSPP